MGRRYTIHLAPTAYTTTVDLCEITPADDKPIKIISFRVMQTTELGDAAEEQIPIAILRGFTTSGSGGAAYTAVPVDHNDAAAGATVEVGNTTIANTGTATTHFQMGWNVRAPIDRPFMPEEQIAASQANTTIVVRVNAAPADSITVGFSLVFEEVS